jgi:hypothetical protein
MNKNLNQVTPRFLDLQKVKIKMGSINNEHEWCLIRNEVRAKEGKLLEFELCMWIKTILEKDKNGVGGGTSLEQEKLMRLDQSAMLNQNNVKGWNKKKLNKSNITTKTWTRSKQEWEQCLIETTLK